ncbi:MAG: hypothetical protein JWR19_1925 [Pedosphaera sp.]|nr:hypothetical protein [Pedosphaera sp.]
MSAVDFKFAIKMKKTFRMAVIGMVGFCLALALAWTGAAAEIENPVTPTQRIDLFNGKDLIGWKLFLPKGEDVTKTWSVENGIIKNTGKPTGYMRTEQDYRDYKLTVEWRFVKVAPKADNTGVLVHMSGPDKLWPPNIQCQGQHDKQGDLFLMGGAESKEHQGMTVNTPVPKRGPSNENPVGGWNTCEMVCAGDSVKASINGKLMNETTGCSISSGRIGIQSEGGEIEIRKIFIEPLKAN